MRLKIIRIFVYSGLMILALGLFRTQVLKGDYYKMLGEKNRVRLIPVEATRGRVFDRQGNLLASNRASYDIVAVPEDVTPDVFPKLADLLQLDESEIRSRMSSKREYPFAPAVIELDVPRALAFKIEEYKSELPGVSIHVSGMRFYPYHETASHIIGYIGKINEREYETLDRDQYGLQSLVGRTGLEKIFDEKLRGWRGGKQLEVDARGRLVNVLSEKKPEPGDDLHLTLDLELQKKIMELINEKNASVAIMDLKTDGLLALASAPSYDPNVFVAPSGSNQRLSLLNHENAPMMDRGVSAAYPPGSVFKLITALAALETGKITPHTRFNCEGHFQIKPGTRKFHCWLKWGHGNVNLYEAIEQSCNVYFYELGKRLSADTIAKYSRMLGLGEKMQIELSRIAPGLVPDSAWKKKNYKERWYTGDTLSYAIGQSYLLTSPLQILRLVAIIAKEGETVEPRILVENDDKNESGKIAVRKDNMRAIRQAMLRVVEGSDGTGQFARVDFDKMAAKSGTAQAPPHEAHSWMAGFFPYKNPEIAFVVFVEHGGSGGVTAAKLVKQVVNLWKESHIVPVG